MCSFLSVKGFTSRPSSKYLWIAFPVVEEAKFLGLLFDKKLSFIPHIKALKAKYFKALDVLKCSPILVGEEIVLSSLICIDL